MTINVKPQSGTIQFGVAPDGTITPLQCDANGNPLSTPAAGTLVPPTNSTAVEVIAHGQANGTGTLALFCSAVGAGATLAVEFGFDGTTYPIAVSGVREAAFNNQAIQVASAFTVSANVLYRFPIVAPYWRISQKAISSGTTTLAAAIMPGTMLATAQGVYSSAGTNLPVGIKLDTSGGLTIAHLVAAATTNPTSLKASAGQVGFASGFNLAAYPVYLKFFNKASVPTPGTDTPIWVEGIPAGARFTIEPPPGVAFATGIAYAITKNIADNDATAVAAEDCVVNIGYA